MQHTRNPTPAGIETAFISLVFAVFACAARFVEDPRLSTGQDDDGGMGMVYYERYESWFMTSYVLSINIISALILHYITHASIQVSHVQIFTLMSAFLCSVNCLPQAWLLTGQAVRSAQDLGLHVRSPSSLSSLSHVSFYSDPPEDYPSLQLIKKPIERYGGEFIRWTECLLWP
jgi:hypothetical protein